MALINKKKHFTKKKHFFNIVKGVVILCFIQSCITLNAQKFYQEVDFEVEHGKIYVQVFVENQPYRFLFDTGASGYGRIDSALAAKLNLKVIGTSENFDGTNTASINNIKVPSVRFAGIHFNDVTLLSRNYNRGKSKTIHGVIGNKFWEDYLLEIDYVQKKMFFSSNSLSLKNENTISYKQPFIVPLQIGEMELKARIDTGSPFTLLFPDKYAKKWNVSELVEGGSARSANTKFKFYYATLFDELNLANNTENNLEVVFSNVITHVNIGIDFLKSYSLSIDQKKKLIMLRKLSGKGH